MAGRRLSPEERDAWARVARTVRARRSADPAGEAEVPAVPAPPPPGGSVLAPRTSLTGTKPFPSGSEPAGRPVDMLDGTWERRIRAGRIVPDMAIDLHGHSLAAAHLRLDRTLAAAIARDARVVHVITGRERKPQDNGDFSGRGAIRAEIGHWLAAGPHAGAIASVRAAHPRHGGAGALYIILRRKR